MITYLHEENNFKDTLCIYVACYAQREEETLEERVDSAFHAMNVMEKTTQKTVIAAGDSLGTFKVTAYCGCRSCNGKWYGQPTASGTDYVEGRTIAVDPKVIPLGTKVVLNGTVYTAEDTGSAIVGKTIDLYMEDHDRCNTWGVRYVEVFFADGNTNTLEITDSKIQCNNYTIADYSKRHTLTKQQQELLQLLSEDEIYTLLLGGGDKSGVIAYAKQQLGTPYSQDAEKRMTTHFDCSSLVYRSYKTVGIELPLTAASQAEYLEKKGYRVSEDNLQPGDLIFYSYTKNGRYKDISHVAIYLGDGQMIEASSSKNAVVMGTFRRSNIQLYGRPQ